MIIETICNFFLNFFTKMLGFIKIPQIPEDTVQSVSGTIDTIITQGSELIDLVIPVSVVKPLLLIVIGIEVAIPVYHFIMWVIKKIPMLGVS